MRAYIVYYKYKLPGTKKPGAVKLYRIYANDAEEAKRMATQHANYPDVEILRITQA